MKKLVSYKKFGNVDESFPQVEHDPIYGTDVFRLRFRQIDDLSNKRSSDLAQKPINDLLDTFQVGDFVSGKSIASGTYHEGKIIKIGKDELGENIDIEIEVDGEMVQIAPATVVLVNDIGNAKQGIATGADQYDPNDLGELQPPAFESKSNKQA